MKLKRVRIYRRTLNKTAGLLKDNPVIVLAVTLPFIIVPAVNLKFSVLISLFIFSVTVPCAVLATFLKDKLSSVYAVPFYSFIAMLIVMALRIKLKDHAVMIEELGIYVWLTAINGIMIKLSAAEPRRSWLYGLKDSVMMCLGFAAACCFVGAAREILGSRTIWDKPFEVYSVGLVGVTMPFFGFIIIGFVSALFRSMDRTVLNAILSAPSRERHKLKEKESAGDMQ